MTRKIRLISLSWQCFPANSQGHRSPVSSHTAVTVPRDCLQEVNTSGLITHDQKKRTEERITQHLGDLEEASLLQGLICSSISLNWWHFKIRYYVLSHHLQICVLVAPVLMCFLVTMAGKAMEAEDPDKAPGFHLTQSRLLQSFRKWTSEWKMEDIDFLSLSLILPPPLSPSPSLPRHNSVF